MPIRAEKLRALGQSVWLDFIRRGYLVSGEFDRVVREQGVVGVTSNPTIFQQAISTSDDYDGGIATRTAEGLSGAALFEALAVEDIQNACDRLRTVYEHTQGLDGRVSIEVSPRLANDTPGSIEEGRRLHREVARENVMVKVPATPEGLPVITELTAEGVCVNVTLIFSISRYEEVMDAYLLGLERRAAKGLALDSIFSVASFFVSRVDTKVDPAIDAAIATLPAGASERKELSGFKGKAAIANARLAYARFRSVFASPRFKPLAARGGHLQRPLWASTSTKNPAYPDTMYVDELVGRDTVNTMPPATLLAYNDHGSLEPRIEHDLDGARSLFARLPALGVPLERLIGQLEVEGVATFAKSFDQLLDALNQKRAALIARAR